MRMRLRPLPHLIAICAAGAMCLSACASTSQPASGDERGFQTGFVGDSGPDSNPSEGGVVVFGSYGFPSTLDPATTPVSGSTGGSELAAIYDVLVRYDNEAGQYVPQLSEGISSSDDGLEWTITLRENTKFSDGTALDAAAVASSFNRFVGLKGDLAQIWTNIVDRIESPDPRTVTIHLKHRWDDFPVLLSMGPGMIVSPTSDGPDGFNPVGAGPFSVDQFTPNEVLELTARPDYIGGPPHLSGMRFVPMPVGQNLFESIQSGQLDAGFIYRDSRVIDTAVKSGLHGYLDSSGLGAVGVINQREGHPGQDLRVRQAIAYGVDPEVISQRASDGLDPAESSLFPETSKWSEGEVHGIAFDPDRARKLLDEAKADGYDGRLKYVSINNEASRQAALAVQASLNSIGFNVEIDYVDGPNDLVRRLYVDRDFDITRSGFNLIESAPFLRLYNSMGSDSNVNAGGYSNGRMDQLLLQLQTAADESGEQKAIDEIQALANETTPFAVWAPTLVFTAWVPELENVTVTTDSILLFDDAWFAK